MLLIAAMLSNWGREGAHARAGATTLLPTFASKERRRWVAESDIHFFVVASGGNRRDDFICRTSLLECK